MTTEQRWQVIGCAVATIVLTGVTIYICRDGFTKWALLTGFLALGGIGGIIDVFEKKPSTGGGAAGLAALFNNMDAKGAENFAQLLNQMGESTAAPAPQSTTAASPTTTKCADGSSPAAGSLLASMAPALSAGATSAATLALGQFRVVVVGTLFDASMDVAMQSALGANNVLHLAVMCFEEGGRDVLQGEDKDKQWRKLEDVQQPAVLYVPRETLPYLKQQPRLWQRVQNREVSHDLG